MIGFLAVVGATCLLVSACTVCVALFLAYRSHGSLYHDEDQS